MLIIIHHFEVKAGKISKRDEPSDQVLNDLELTLIIHKISTHLNRPGFPTGLIITQKLSTM